MSLIQPAEPPLESVPLGNRTQNEPLPPQVSPSELTAAAYSETRLSVLLERVRKAANPVRLEMEQEDQENEAHVKPDFEFESGTEEEEEDDDDADWEPKQNKQRKQQKQHNGRSASSSCVVSKQVPRRQLSGGHLNVDRVGRPVCCAALIAQYPTRVRR